MGSSKTTIAAGLLSVAIGLVPILIATGVIAPERGHAAPSPGWLAILTGLLFVIGGLAVVVQGACTGQGRPHHDLPASAPRWLRAVYHLMILAVIASLAAIVTWVAVGPGERHFGGSVAFLGETFGRVIFGIGAALSWLIAIAVAVSLARRRRVPPA